MTLLKFSWFNIKIKIIILFYYQLLVLIVPQLYYTSCDSCAVRVLELEVNTNNLQIYI